MVYNDFNRDENDEITDEQYFSEDDGRAVTADDEVQMAAEDEDGFLGDVGIGCIALALNGPVFARHRQGYEIDSKVVPGAEVRSIREVPPQPDLGEKPLESRQCQKIRPHQLLELRALLRLRQRLTPIPRQQLVKLHSALLPFPAAPGESAAQIRRQKRACLVRDIPSEAPLRARLGNTKNGHAERVHSKA